MQIYKYGCRLLGQLLCVSTSLPVLLLEPVSGGKVRVAMKTMKTAKTMKTMKKPSTAMKAMSAMTSRKAAEKQSTAMQTRKKQARATQTRKRPSTTIAARKRPPGFTDLLCMSDLQGPILNFLAVMTGFAVYGTCTAASRALYESQWALDTYDRCNGFW